MSGLILEFQMWFSWGGHLNHEILIPYDKFLKVCHSLTINFPPSRSDTSITSWISGFLVRFAFHFSISWKTEIAIRSFIFLNKFQSKPNENCRVNVSNVTTAKHTFWRIPLFLYLRWIFVVKTLYFFSKTCVI